RDLPRAARVQRHRAPLPELLRVHPQQGPDGRGRRLRPARGGSRRRVQPELFRGPGLRVGPGSDAGHAGPRVTAAPMLPAQARGHLRLLDSSGRSGAPRGEPRRPSMEVGGLGRTSAGEPVFTAREALEADGVVLVNRVKPHTDFESVRVGSGLVKMTAIGLGKVEGAAAAHRAARRHGYEESITAAARVVRARLKLLAGVALLEDAHHRLAQVEVVPAAEMEAREPALLARARSWMPSLPFPEVDILILAEIGENVSGGGMDAHARGR